MAEAKALKADAKPLNLHRKFPLPFKLYQTTDSAEAEVGTFTPLLQQHVVHVNTQFLSLSPSSQSFVLLHECGHIKHRDFHMRSLTAIVILSLSHFFFPGTPSVWFLLDTLTQVAICAIAERRADAFAIGQATANELRGGIAFLRNRISNRMNSNQSATLFEKIAMFCKDFYYHILEGHPSNSSRILTLENALRNKI